MPYPFLAPRRLAASMRAAKRALHSALARLHGLLFRGWAPLAGALAATGTAAAFSPAWALPAYALGALGSRVWVRHRDLGPQETALAQAVFGKAFPFGRRIIVTDLCGLGGTCFVGPGLGRQILVNLGRHAFAQPTHCCSSIYHAPGKLLVHELAHAWQIAHGHYYPRLWRRLLAGPNAGDSFYRPPPSLSPPWAMLNLEQQATVVDEWFAPGRLGPDGWAGSPGMSPFHPYWDYVRTVIRGEHDGISDDMG